LTRSVNNIEIQLKEIIDKVDFRFVEKLNCNEKNQNESN